MDRHSTKTQKQLVNMICAHTQPLNCMVCSVPLGKLVLIPVDVTPDGNVIGLCNDCLVDVLKTKRSWYARLKILIERVQNGQRKYPNNRPVG